MTALGYSSCDLQPHRGAHQTSEGGIVKRSKETPKLVRHSGISCSWIGKYLESMEISSEMYGCFFTPIVKQKLLEEFRTAITQNLESETWNMKDILGEFHKELQLREQCLVNNKESRPSNQRGELTLSTSALYVH